MPERTVQLVVQYDGSRYAGWQRQPGVPTVQGELERITEQLFGARAAVIGAGRTDAGVHARGQAAHIAVPQRWRAASLRRAMNALLPRDVWIAAAHEMVSGFHARYSAAARRYTYYVGTDAGADSPFRRPFEWRPPWTLDSALLAPAAAMLAGEHCFRGFAVRGTAPASDDHRCVVYRAEWVARPRGHGVAFEIEANRFLHHMVRFLVGTMVDVAAGRRPLAAFATLLGAESNAGAAAPAPARGLFLDAVVYPADLYLESE